MKCWKCGAALEENDYGRKDTCPTCGFDTRVCKNCVHYSPDQHNECRETQADRTVEKERSNFCDYFKPGSPATNADDKRAEALSAAEALFKKS